MIPQMKKQGRCTATADLVLALSGRYEAECVQPSSHALVDLYKWAQPQNRNLYNDLYNEAAHFRHFGMHCMLDSLRPCMHKIIHKQVLLLACRESAAQLRFHADISTVVSRLRACRLGSGDNMLECSEKEGNKA